MGYLMFTLKVCHIVDAANPRIFVRLGPAFTPNGTLDVVSIKGERYSIRKLLTIVGYELFNR